MKAKISLHLSRIARDCAVHAHRYCRIKQKHTHNSITLVYATGRLGRRVHVGLDFAVCVCHIRWGFRRIYFSFHKNICLGHSLEVPLRGISYE